MAFRTKTVFVVGAGASCELGFPSGPKLLQDIAAILDIRFDHSQKSGSFEVMAAFRMHHAAHHPNEDLNDYLRASWRLREAAQVARSIDNAMDQNSDNPLVEIAGKLSIAHAMLRAEAKSKLFVDPTARGGVRLAQAVDTWLHHFAQMLTTDLRRTEVDRIFENVAVVTFNYDRSIQHYLPAALSAAYGLDEREARSVVANLEIHHAYGQVGTLPWVADGVGSIEYGFDPGHRLETIASGLQTFTESREPDEQLRKLHNCLRQADRIVFLGFAFHRPNMDLLRPPGGIRASQVTGTVFQEPPPAQDVAHKLVTALFDKGEGRRDRVSLSNSPAAQFMLENYSVLTQ